jgi:hypothetical protein
MILMAWTASDGWENYAVDEYRHIIALFLHKFKIFAGPKKYFLNMRVHCSPHWGTLTHQCFHSDITGMCLVCSQIGCRDTGHNNLEGETTWIEGSIRVGPLGLLDAGPFRSMI